MPDDYVTMVPPPNSDEKPWNVSRPQRKSAFRKRYRPRGWTRAPETDLNVDEMTVDEVLSEVGDDPDEALAVMIAEKQGHDRVTLTDALAKLIEQE